MFIVSYNIYYSTLQSCIIFRVTPHIFCVTAVVFNFTAFFVTKIASLFCSIYMKFFICREKKFFEIFLNHVRRLNVELISLALRYGVFHKIFDNRHQVPAM
jgi:hypothetical protein